VDQYTAFPFLRNLEHNWTEILAELESLLYKEAECGISLFQPWHEEDIYEGDWDVYGLYYKKKKLKENCERCPKTTALLETIPDLVTAGFSSLAPGTHIVPHHGQDNTILRCHLGLIVPKPLPDYDRRATGILTANTCALRVGSEMYYWEPGQTFMFDDTEEHEAFNFGDRTRFVLLVDVKKPKWWGGVTP
jgi:beta-hydroxylase